MACLCGSLQCYCEDKCTCKTSECRCERCHELSSYSDHKTDESEVETSSAREEAKSFANLQISDNQQGLNIPNPLFPGWTLHVKPLSTVPESVQEIWNLPGPYLPKDHKITSTKEGSWNVDVVERCSKCNKNLKYVLSKTVYLSVCQSNADKSSTEGDGGLDESNDCSHNAEIPFLCKISEEIESSSRPLDAKTPSPIKSKEADENSVGPFDAKTPPIKSKKNDESGQYEPDTNA